MALSDGDDFFKKGATSYPSGHDAATGKETKPRFAKVYGGFAAVAVGTATMIAALACDAKIIHDAKNYPEAKKQELTSAYDASLLTTIDSLYEEGLPMEVAVEKGNKIHSYRIRKETDFNAEGVVQRSHAQKRLAQSREIDHIHVTKKPSLGYSHLYGRLTVEDETVYDTVYAYRPEFRDRLAEELYDYQQSVRRHPATMTTGRGYSR